MEYEVPCPDQYLKDIKKTNEDRDRNYAKLINFIESSRSAKLTTVHALIDEEFVEYFQELFRSQGWNVSASQGLMFLSPKKESSNA